LQPGQVANLDHGVARPPGMLPRSEIITYDDTLSQGRRPLPDLDELTEPDSAA